MTVQRTCSRNSDTVLEAARAQFGQWLETSPCNTSGDPGCWLLSTVLGWPGGARWTHDSKANSTVGFLVGFARGKIRAWHCHSKKQRQLYCINRTERLQVRALTRPATDHSVPSERHYFPRRRSLWSHRPPPRPAPRTPFCGIPPQWKEKMMVFSRAVAVLVAVALGTAAATNSPTPVPTRLECQAGSNGPQCEYS